MVVQPATDRDTAPPDVVVLGASNVTFALPQVLKAARKALGSPCRFHIAAGHGRSYCGWSSLIVRSLPGLRACRLWPQLETREGSPLYALITDIGNDVGYGVPVPRILDHLRECLDLLHQRGARVVVSELPEESLKRVEPWRYLFFRSIFFPGNSRSFTEMLDCVDQIQDWLKKKAAAGEFRLAPQPGRWFGFDPIHLRRSVREEAFGSFFGHWSPAGETSAVDAPLSLPRRPLRPAHRKFFGFEQFQPQPVWTFAEGSDLSLY